MRRGAAALKRIMRRTVQTASTAILTGMHASRKLRRALILITLPSLIRLSERTEDSDKVAVSNVWRVVRALGREKCREERVSLMH